MLNKIIPILAFVFGISAFASAQTINTSYYSSGKIQSTFYSSGNITERVVYFENGATKEIATFKDNQAHGTWKYFDESGRVVKTSFYFDGEKTGVWTVWSYLAENYIAIDYSKNKPMATNLVAESRFE